MVLFHHIEGTKQVTSQTLSSIVSSFCFPLFYYFCSDVTRYQSQSFLLCVISRQKNRKDCACKNWLLLCLRWFPISLLNVPLLRNTNIRKRTQTHSCNSTTHSAKKKQKGRKGSKVDIFFGQQGCKTKHAKQLQHTGHTSTFTGDLANTAA